MKAIIIIILICSKRLEFNETNNINIRVNNNTIW